MSLMVFHYTRLYLRFFLYHSRLVASFSSQVFFLFVVFGLNDWYRNVRRVGYEKHDMTHYNGYNRKLERQIEKIIMLQHELKRSLKLLWESK
jgi:hypothetical protein